MSKTKKIDGIITNLSREELVEFIRALDTGKARQIPDTGSCFAASAGCQFKYKGRQYEINETYEVIDLVVLLPKGRSTQHAAFMTAIEDLR